MNLLLELREDRWDALLKRTPYRAEVTFTGGFLTMRCRFCWEERCIVVERRKLTQAKFRVEQFAHQHRECPTNPAATSGMTRCCQ